MKFGALKPVHRKPGAWLNSSSAARAKVEAWVHKASIWPIIKRLDPTFDTKAHGHASFAEILKALDAVIEIKKSEADYLVRFC